MNWGAWIGTVLIVSFIFGSYSLVGFLAYHQGHLEGFKKGLRNQTEIKEKYK